MAVTTQSEQQTGLRGVIQRFFSGAPMLAILLGFLACSLWEMMIGEMLASVLLLPKMPILFGLVTMFKVIAGMINLVLKDTPFEVNTLLYIPMALLYFTVVYVLPFAMVVRLTTRPANAIARSLQQLPLIVTALVHLGFLYATFHFWAEMSDYRLISLKITLIAVLLTLSLNIINGYMGEFSCSHPGFMAIGAYMSSFFTVGLFVNDKVLGDALLGIPLAYLTFPFALIFGGVCASLGALIVAIPSFRTRGDYLAIISLAFFLNV
ncbi:MAG: hypothetical protein QNK29_14485, partial [Desulfobacterales bacterium]|nr:hypothetical protein [Desulfobacterales bacterium]MDX2513182.1 hypothetical protein [Desulfobacterales bacterium]